MIRLIGRPPLAGRPAGTTRVDQGWRLISLGWDFGMLPKELGDTIKATRAAIGK